MGTKGEVSIKAEAGGHLDRRWFWSEVAGTTGCSQPGSRTKSGWLNLCPDPMNTGPHPALMTQWRVPVLLYTPPHAPSTVSRPRQDGQSGLAPL